MISVELATRIGVRVAIKRGCVVIGIDKNEIISAFRFYPRKSDGVVSIYQFAVDEKYRRNELVQKMLNETKFEQFEFKCLRNIDFNNYYKKIGANISKQDDKYNYWVLINKK